MRWAAAALAGLLVLAASCGDGDGPSAEPPPEAPLAATATRSSLFDSQRTFRLVLRNESDEAVTVEAVQLRSPRFELQPPSPRDTQLAPAQQLLLPVPYGMSVCPAGDEADVLVATIGGEEV